jgi:hypothetical protein
MPSTNSGSGLAGVMNAKTSPRRIVHPNGECSPEREAGTGIGRRGQSRLHRAATHGNGNPKVQANGFKDEQNGRHRRRAMMPVSLVPNLRKIPIGVLSSLAAQQPLFITVLVHWSPKLVKLALLQINGLKQIEQRKPFFSGMRLPHAVRFTDYVVRWF